MGRLVQQCGRDWLPPTFLPVIVTFCSSSQDDLPYPDSFCTHAPHTCPDVLPTPTLTPTPFTYLTTPMNLTRTLDRQGQCVGEEQGWDGQDKGDVILVSLVVGVLVLVLDY